jgi:RNA polymerase sigma-19 factor, ECF subfamily
MITASRIRHLQYRIAQLSDQQAYKELFISFQPHLLSFAKTILPSSQSAEEAVSDVFIKIWERRSTLLKIANLKVYLYTATRNTALNYWHKEKRRRIEHLEHVDIASLHLDPEQLLVSAEIITRIQKAIDQLPPKCRLICRLAKEDGLRYSEIAEILKISVKTVENQLAIALKKIAKAVRHHSQLTQSQANCTTKPDAPVKTLSRQIISLLDVTVY